jgi:hypothetical protein
MALEAPRMPTRGWATVADLYHVPGKAELVHREIVHMPPAGDAPGTAADEITAAPAALTP